MPRIGEWDDGLCVGSKGKRTSGVVAGEVGMGLWVITLREIANRKKGHASGQKAMELRVMPPVKRQWNYVLYLRSHGHGTT